MPRAAPPESPSVASPARRAAALGGLAALGLVAALGGAASALVGVAARSGPEAGPAPVLAVAPPWADISAIVERAGGRPVSPVDAPLAVLATGPGPDFPARLKAAGAWFALDGRRLAQLCGAAG